MPNGSPWPRISIVTPSYNQAPFIEETIRSVLLQGYPDLEYVIMDGGSTDGSVEIIRRYEPWLGYVHVGSDEGQAAAIREGFRHTTGEILAYLNSDDIYLPGALGRAAQFFARRPRVVLANGDAYLVDVNGRAVRRWYALRPNRFLTANMCKQNWAQPACFWRSWAYERVGGVDPALRYCLDLDLFIRLMGVGPGRRIPGPPLAAFRLHEQAKSATMLDVYRQETAALIEKYRHPRLRGREGLLRWMWRWWHRPLGVRAWLHRTWGWEW